MAFSKKNPQIGYVQGMNYLAASLLFHCADYIAYAIFNEIIDHFAVSEIFKEGLPGLKMHANNFI